MHLRAAKWLLAGLLLLSICDCTGEPAVAVKPPAPIDEGQRVTLYGNTHPAATAANDLGPVADGMLLEHLQLVLSRSPEREAALETVIDALHDKTSPSYQQWLTATQFGEQWGVPTAELDTVEAWLQRHGFRIDGVPPSRMFIEFTGTVAQVNATFQTDIHALSVDGVRHYANMRDPSIPAAFAGTVVGVHALHDFRPHPMYRPRGGVRRDATTGLWSGVRGSSDLTFSLGQECFSNADCPNGGTCNTTTGVCSCTASNQCHATLSGAAASCGPSGTCIQCRSNADCVGPSTCNTTTNICNRTYQAVVPADFATIYNLNPLFAEGITGKGVTIAVVEDTLLQNPSDVTTFRTAFGLTGYGGTFSQFVATGTAATCTNPGVVRSESEAALDAEWSGATAPGATIELAACADTTNYGPLLAVENLVNAATPPQVISISYGVCEASNGAAENASFVNSYQQAASEGISVFVSSGDQGAASCDASDATQTRATQGIAVSGWASTPYNVAVGGTDFADYWVNQQGGPATSTYWAATNTATFGSALSYVPEIPWNNSCASRAIYSTSAVTLGAYTQGYGATGFCNSPLGSNPYFQNFGAGSGGPSTYSNQPTWQTGVVGLPTSAGGKRYLPDVSLFAASGTFGHFLLFCMTDAVQGGGPCVYSNAHDSLALAAGGTSFAAPALAGIQALINQKMGAAQGNPNYTYYKFAAAEAGPRGSTRCNSTGGTVPTPLLPHAECIFNDVTEGDIVVDCTGPNCFGATGTTVVGSLSTSTTAFAPAYAAGPGWDFATGLGSVNAYNLVTAWSK